MEAPGVRDSSALVVAQGVYSLLRSPEVSERGRPPLDRTGARGLTPTVTLGVRGKENEDASSPASSPSFSCFLSFLLRLPLLPSRTAGDWRIMMQLCWPGSPAAGSGDLTAEAPAMPLPGRPLLQGPVPCPCSSCRVTSCHLLNFLLPLRFLLADGTRETVPKVAKPQFLAVYLLKILPSSIVFSTCCCALATVPQ